MACCKDKSVQVKFKKLTDSAIVPEYKSVEAAGMDLCSDIDVTLFGSTTEVAAPGRQVLVKTGIAIKLPVGYEAQVRPRSGLAYKHGVTVLNTPGTIDSDYIGELGVILINFGVDDFKIRKGDRIAQLVIAPVSHVNMVEVEELEETERGTGGFGSTGK
jgi:dUTP pyrophosphatase